MIASQFEELELLLVGRVSGVSIHDPRGAALLASNQCPMTVPDQTGMCLVPAAPGSLSRPILSSFPVSAVYCSRAFSRNSNCTR